jgi:subtilase family serine protease
MVDLGSFKHTGMLEKDSSYNQSALIKIPPYISGNYYVFVATDIESHVYEHAKELNNQSESSDTIEVMLVSPADLIISHASANETLVTNDDKVTISWFTRNIGVSPTPGEWYDNVYLHNKKTTDLRGAIQISKFLQTQTLELGDSKYSSVECQIPNTIFGTYYVYVLADGYNQIFEMGNDDNNLYRFDSIHIITPDIEVSDLKVPESDSSYHFINISWKTANVGETNIKGKPIKYGVYISTDSEFNANATRIDSLIFQFPLYVNSSIKFTKKIRLPEGASGDLYLYVVADYNDDIEEGANEENNVVKQPIEVILSPWADLSYTDIVSVDTIRAGYNMSFSYSVTNTGTSDLDKRLWNDYFYVLHLDDLDCGQRCATHLKTEQHYQSLAMGATEQFDVEVMMPGELDKGWYQLVIKGDSENQIFENTGEPNLIHKLIYIEDYPVDLEVTDFTIPDTASFGDKINVKWTVENLSDIPTLGERWVDEVYISKDNILNRDLDKKLGHRLNKRQLGAGKSYTCSKNIKIPMGITGENYLIVTNGDYNTPVDSNRSNNSLAKPIYVKETPTPDLELLNFEAPEVLTAGRNINIKYEVTNNGSADVIVNSHSGWEDRVYLTTKTGNITINKNDKRISTINNKFHLPVNDSYSYERTVFIPGSISGNYVLSLITDFGNRIYEYKAEGNNQINLPVEVVLPPPCDLIVKDIQHSDSAKVGDSLTVGWSVVNNSGNSVEGRKIDMIYLSKDKMLDQSDVLFCSDTSYITLSANEEVQSTVTSRLKNVIDGEYYILSKTDILNDIYESNDTNNTGCSVIPMVVQVDEIPFDSLVNKNLYNNYEGFYKFNVPDSVGGESILVTLKGDSLNAQNQIYLAYENMPTKGIYDYGAKEPEKGNQTLVVSEANPGDYYIMVYGYNSIQDVQGISLEVEVLNLELFSIVQNTGGNTGKVTVQLNGAKFGSDLQVILKNASDTVAMEINELHYKLTVDDKSAGQALYTFIDSVSNADGIYIKYGEEASTENYDYGISGPYSDDTTVVIYPLREGEYFITIYQSAQEGHLGVSFNPPHTAIIESTNTYDTNSYILPEKVEVIHSTLAYATYDLKDKRTGMYHIILMSDEEIFIALDQFEIVQGLPLDLMISVRHPSLVRSFETFKYTIDFKNNGNIDIDKNELVIKSYERAPIGHTIKQLEQNMQEVVVKLTEANGPENILRPGASGSIVIYTSAIMDALMCFGIEYPDIYNE